MDWKFGNINNASQKMAHHSTLTKPLSVLSMCVSELFSPKTKLAIIQEYSLHVYQTTKLLVPITNSKKQCQRLLAKMLTTYANDCQWRLGKCGVNQKTLVKCKAINSLAKTQIKLKYDCSQN